MNTSNIYLEELHEKRLKSWNQLIKKFKNCESEKQYSLDDLLELDEYSENLIEVNDEDTSDSSDLHQTETDSVDSVSYVLKCKEQSKNCNKIKLKKLLHLKNNSLGNTTQNIDNTALICKDENKMNWTIDLKNKINNNYRRISEDKSDNIFSDTKANKLLEMPKENWNIEQTDVVVLNETSTKECNAQISAKPEVNIEKVVFFLNQDILDDMKKKDNEIFEKSCKTNFITKINGSRYLASKLDLERKRFHSKLNLILNEKYVKFQEEPAKTTYIKTTSTSEKQICHNDLAENGATNIIRNTNLIKMTDITKKLQNAREIEKIDVDAGKMLPKESSLNIQENVINNKTIECTRKLNETFVLDIFDDNKIYSPSKNLILANENAKINQAKLLNCLVTENNENGKIGIFDKNGTMKQSQNLNGKTTKYTKKKAIAKENLVRNCTLKDNSEITTFTEGLMHQQKLKNIDTENIELDYSNQENTSEHSVNQITQAIQKQVLKCTKYRDTLKIINAEYINPGKTNQENIPEIVDSENILGSNKKLIHKIKRKLKKHCEKLKSFDTENINTDYINQENVSENVTSEKIHENQKELIHKNNRKLNKYRDKLKSIDAENIKTGYINQEVSENSASENIEESKKELIHNKKTILENNREKLISIDTTQSDNSNQEVMHKLKKNRERLKNIDADNIETDESNSATSNISETSNVSTKKMLHWDKLEIINTENAGIFPCNFKNVKHDILKNHESIYTKRKRKSPVKTIEELAKKQNVSHSTKRNFNTKNILNPPSKSVQILTLDYFLNDEFWGESS